MHLTKRADDIGTWLKPILESIPERLSKACGGVVSPEDGSEDELQDCTWKAKTVEYILQFP